ncbi:DUF6298 domain-containing protein [Telluribacter sp.]|jgi:hypothetical protein|uniref:DUF6298 domain-containing protein n=1 Tax=Telluribacter sp. TaxID=1978767 RepID=UPI002E12AC2B|nr:DUF6298 domain-containing protein [Telluribacter sp.]
MKNFFLRVGRAFSLLAVLYLAEQLPAFGQTSGPLQLHPQNPHYFQYQNKPLVLVGSGEHYGAVINLDFDYKKYLQATAQDGMNTTRLFTGAYIEKLGDFGIQKNTLAPAEGRVILPWKRSGTGGYTLGGNKFDLNQWNEEYFARLKDFMTVANQQGVVVEICLFSAHYGGGWNYSPFNPKNNVNNTNEIGSVLVNTLENGNILAHQEKYVRKLVLELNGFTNFYLEIQNEPWAEAPDKVMNRNEYGPAEDWKMQYQVVSKKSDDWHRRVAQWIKDEEKSLANKHLISQNISNFSYPITEADPNISIFTFHYALPEAVRENYHLNRVIGFNETGFAGSKNETYRRQAWRFMMVGGGLFNQLDYSYSVGSESGQDTSYKAPGGGSPALRAQFKIMKNFLNGLNLPTLQPDLSVVKAAPGTHTTALSDGKSQWVIYLEQVSVKGYPLTLNLPRGTYQAEWMDVTTGQKLPATTVTNGQLPVPESTSDKVVVIRAASARK